MGIQTTPESGNRTPKQVISVKTAACAVALGAAIVNEMVGVQISDVQSEDSNELMAAAISTELKL